MAAIRLLLVDNHDSFTWNLVQYLGELGAKVRVCLADGIRPREVLEGGYDGCVISPGPGRPEDAGISVPLVRELAGRLPVLGVCLGHQAIARAFGAAVVRAPEIVHGKTSPVLHDGRGVFRGIPRPFEATRYHSLAVDPATLPREIRISARSPDGVVMGIRHAAARLEGVQFHPESVVTAHGKALLGNFLRGLSPGRPGGRG